MWFTTDFEGGLLKMYYEVFWDINIEETNYAKQNSK